MTLKFEIERGDKEDVGEEMAPDDIKRSLGKIEGIVSGLKDSHSNLECTVKDLNKTLSSNVRELDKKIDDVNHNLIALNGSSAKKEDCAKRERYVDRRISDIAKTVTAAQTTAEEAFEEVSGVFDNPLFPAKETVKDWKATLKDNLTLFITIAAALSILGGMFVGLGRFSTAYEKIMKTQTVQSREANELRKAVKEVLSAEKAKNEEAGYGGE